MCLSFESTLALLLLTVFYPWRLFYHHQSCVLNKHICCGVVDGAAFLKLWWLRVQIFAGKVLGQRQCPLIISVALFADMHGLVISFFSSS